MTAKEMFEELGFRLCRDDDIFKVYGIKDDKNGRDDDPFNWDYVHFNKEDKTYNVDIMIDDVDIKLHKAINQELKDLGWIE